ncbi:hypothetical protein ACFXG4_20480 [Nocardia sp. NPDC059246]|uniref:hypothetical protein n=1 Tax=unclassified Nocardia TaxID=2637762 RepID=UPI0036A715EA
MAQRRKSARVRLRELVDLLDDALPEDWTADELLATVERLRGRRIIRLPLPAESPVGLCGMWLASNDFDVFVLRDSHDPHDVFHELGHVLLDHGQDAQTEELTTLLPGLSADLRATRIRAFRRASSYDRPEEYEAELFATMVRTLVRADGPRRDRFLKAF